MADEPTQTSTEPPRQVLYAFYVVLFIVLIATLILVGVYGT